MLTCVRHTKIHGARQLSSRQIYDSLRYNSNTLQANDRSCERENVQAETLGNELKIRAPTTAYKVDAQEQTQGIQEDLCPHQNMQLIELLSHSVNQNDNSQWICKITKLLMKQMTTSSERHASQMSGTPASFLPMIGTWRRAADLYQRWVDAS